jgi:Protein of unknown function (DUF2950)
MKNFENFRAEMLFKVALVAALATFSAFGLQAQTTGQKTFSSAKEAVDGFIQAVRSSDSAGLLSILGAGTESIVSSGDAVSDKNARDKFLARYDASHKLVQAGPHEVTLTVGTDGWPLPIPIVENGGKWYFDGAAGKEEVLYRRIGHNELSAIDVCKGIVSAQKDYAATSHDGKPAGTYAERTVSTAGTQNGLYWETKPGEPSSPAGDLLAEASSEGYGTPGNRVPYHGYYYRMLKNPGGFAFIAYPAQYRSSGVMTFIVTQKGVVYEKDLGEKTDDIAQHLEKYPFDNTWKRAQ